MWFSCGERSRPQLSDQPSSRRVTPSFRALRPNLAGRPQPGQLLSWTLLPCSTRGIEDPLAADFTCPLRSARRVWLPSRRLTPFDPVPVLFRTGGAHGIRPSEPSPSARYRRRFRRDEPTCRSSCRFSNR